MTQSPSWAQLVLHAVVPLQAYSPQEVVVASGQTPFAQLAAFVWIPAAQLAARHWTVG